MKKLALYALLLVLALNAFGHAGEVHKYMGTITAVSENGSFTLKKTDGTSMTVEVSPKTTYVYTNGTTAPRTEVAPGRRVVVTISTDGKTASEIKLAKK